MSDSKIKIALFLLIFLSACLIVFTNQIILRDFKNSADEYSQFLQAKIFSAARLSVPSPENKEFFNVADVINNGRFYSKFPPGWPFFLMWGIILKMPMLINLIFGILTLILIYKLAIFLFNKKVAHIVLLLMSFNAFFIFNSASYFTHPSTLFFLTLTTYLYFLTLRYNKVYIWFIFGASVGIAFNIRPYTTVAFVLPFLFYELCVVVVKRKRPLNQALAGWGIFILSFSIFLAIFLGYNYLQTRHVLKMPFRVYNVHDTLGFAGKYAHTPTWSFLNNIVLRTFNLNLWIPFFIIFVPIALYKIDGPKRREIYLLFSVFLSLLIGYFFYPQGGSDEYGPRYLYCSSVSLFILMAVGIEKLTRKKRRFSALFLFIFSILFFINRGFYFHKQVNARMQLYDRVKEEKISNAIIFLSTGSGSMPASLLTRNDISFNADILFVRDLKEKNRLLMKQYPDRDYYYWMKTKSANKLVKITN